MPATDAKSAWEAVAVDDETLIEGATEHSLESLAQELAQRHHVTRQHPARRILLKSLSQHGQALQEIYRHFVRGADPELALSYATEWFLDNYYVIQRAQRLIKEDLPADYYNELPRLLNKGALQGYPRIYAVARAFVVHEDCQLEIGRIRHFVDAYQDVQDMTMGELWALPLMLRLVLLESILQAGSRLTGASVPDQNGIVPLYFEVDEADIIAACIPSLHRLANQDWKTFFESISRVEQILRSDPARLYARMDFETRDRYRKIVEKLALATAWAEEAVARAAIERATKPLDGQIRMDAVEDEWAGLQLPRAAHVGYYLLAEGRAQLEETLNYRPTGTGRLRRALFDHPTLVYLGSVSFLALLILSGILWYVRATMGSPAQQLLALLLVIVPALGIAVSLVNWLLTELIEPRVLPKLDFSEGIPEACRTIIVIPSMFTGLDEVQSLVRQLELHYLRNPDLNLYYALLTDFADAPTGTTDGDRALLDVARAEILALNKRHGRQAFYLFHRRRQWNESEGVWMGWERKRGKLHEFNRLLRGDENSSYIVKEGALNVLRTIKYVITLDADTILSRDSAHRLVGTLAHPLNQAQFDRETGKVVAGYTILQPRAEIQPTSAAQSLFTQVFAGDTGLDLYTLAVSDVYQDLFGVGIYVGKGIYDVDAFERSLQGVAPENALLSHDLFEGIHGRVALATDIILYEEFPPNYLIHVRRSYRWVRGDWQLIPWLLPWVPRADGWGRNKLQLIDRWKIVDNLRRSILSPALLLLFLAGWTILPGSPLVWMLFGLLTPAVSLATSMFTSTVQAIRTLSWRNAYYPVRNSVVRWLLYLAFLPYESILVIDAVGTTLWRLIISRKHLLQWTSAAHTTRILGTDVSSNVTWRQMLSSLFTTLILAALVVLYDPGALLTALPLLVIWLLSPQLAYRISQPQRRRRAELSFSEHQELRRLARRTWLFFEHFVGPDDNWLPPDHYQESPKGVVAHRTSPTNFGLYLSSALAAYHFGYLGPLDLVLRLRPTFETLEKMDRYRGHFLNWIDTRNLTPLPPRYVSTVDSGNFAACLLALRQGCMQILQHDILRWERWRGFLDTIAILDDVIADVDDGKHEKITRLREHLGQMQQLVNDARDDISSWIPLFKELDGRGRAELDQLMLDVVESDLPFFNTATLRSWRLHVEGMHIHLNSMRRELEMLAPWLLILDQPPALFLSSELPPELKEMWQRVNEALPSNPTLAEVPKACQQARQRVAKLLKQLDEREVIAPELQVDAAQWCRQLLQQLEEAQLAVESLLSGYDNLIDQAESYFNEMDFRFLFDRQRQVFHIGYNLDTGQLDNNYYDLLASEARITSLLAIAKNDVPQSHWLHLARPITEVDGGRTLLSWSGTMFEYLMPALLMQRYEGTLLNESDDHALMHHIRYGQEHDIPWGISESGFYTFDSAMNYQYRAFGVPGLGFKRGLREDLVVAPYASLLALSIRPRDVMDNILALKAQGMLGHYGFYEALDFTPTRLKLGNRKAVVQSFMAHHQGMILVSLLNYLYDDQMVKYFHADPRIQSAELLLQEQVPYRSPLEYPHREDEDVILPAELTVAMHPWSVPLHSPVPSVHVLSNGRYQLLATNAGGGYSRWQHISLTRWRADVTLDNWGQWLYLQDEDSGAVWSVGMQPSAGTLSGSAGQGEAFYHSYMVEYRRRLHDVVARMDIVVPPGDDVEIRRIRINNDSDERRRLRLTSYSEVVLAEQDADERHQAFVKLFVESDYVPAQNALVFRRRPRSDEEKPLFLAHTLLVGDELVETQRFESDRARFLGRGGTIHNPAALESRSWLSGQTGATLDPIMSIGQQVELEPRTSVEIAFVTVIGRSRARVMDLVSRYRSWSNIERGFDQARAAAERTLRRLEIDTPALEQAQKLLSLLVFPSSRYRAEPSILKSNERGQPALWGFGISGDYPILLLELQDEADAVVLQEVLRVHAYWRALGLQIDLVILNQKESNYGQELQGVIHRMVRQENGDNWLSRRGGIFILRSDQMQEAERILLYSAARVVLDARRGVLATQLADFYEPSSWLPAFSPSGAPAGIEEVAPIERPNNLQFDNEFGGFSGDGREYIVYVKPGETTPAPWINVIANPGFGFLVSEAGAGYTWALNSGENRLTTWRNDPVTDTPSEALYIRDEETGAVWSPTPQPAPAEAPYLVRHGAGYSIFQHNSHTLKQTLRLFVAADDPVKILTLRLENTQNRQRRLIVTYYAEWVLGTDRDTQQYILPEYGEEYHALFARNPYNVEFGDRVAFMATCREPHGLTADRTEFLGRLGSYRRPAALERIGLENRVQPGRDACAAMQLHVNLGPGESETVYFLLGQGAHREEAVQLLRRFQNEQEVERAWEATHERWNEILETVQVETPDPAMNLLLNRWLLYQAIACRIWGRSALYQSSGAYGFRDQLQDVMSVVHVRPELAREQILRAARHQFEEGDVLHWWHPPSGRGVRTRIRDDLLWLPYVTAHYIAVTGDTSVLEEEVPLLQGEPLQNTEEERYGHYSATKEIYSIFEHCRRALVKGSTAGRHGLPLMGGGDWNDGMNRVGIEGQGESVWLGWFLHATLTNFAQLCEQIGEEVQARTYRQQAEELRQALEAGAWDGNWYRRAYYDDGTPLGSIMNLECQIDAIAQSWGVISGAANPERAELAMEAVRERLVKEEERLILLFTPPLDKTKKDPGYIKGYLPGIRENGGQYTHAALWTIWAYAQMGQGGTSERLFRLINPIYRADSREKALHYKVEPYVISADVYGVEPHRGRGGWTWYTGSSGWMYRLGLERILGFVRKPQALVLEPRIPPAWQSYRITYRFGRATYEIEVENEGDGQAVVQVTLDGQALPGPEIPLHDDGARHQVRVRLGG